MSKYLLDTQTLLHWDGDLPIGAAACAVLSTPNNTFYISHVSIWEIAIKTQIGKLTLPDSLQSWVQRSIIQNRFTLEAIDLNSIIYSGTLPFHHRDPFDRMLISQALTNQWEVLGSDTQWDAYGVTRIWD